MTKVDLTDLAIDEVTASDLEEAQQYIGTAVPKVQHHNRATPDAIRHFAIAIADDNPLWVDRDYAKDSRWGGIIAPPSFLMSVNNGNASPGLERMLRLGSSWDLEYFEPIRVETEFRTSTSIVGAELLERKRGGKMVKQTTETQYRDDSGTLLARGLADCFRLPMKGNGSPGYVPRRAKYTEDELDKIERDILAEECRGATVRRVGDVSVGESLGQVVKGPLEPADFGCWYAAYNMVSFAGWPLESRIRRRDTSAVRDWRLQHALKSHPELSGEVGMPGVWMGGPAIFSWIVHLLTNWYGDDGFLRRLKLEMRRPAVMGDTVWCTGLVAAISDGLVKCELLGTNQIDEKVVQAQAWVELPKE